jgi:hypothetical protein
MRIFVFTALILLSCAPNNPKKQPPAEVNSVETYTPGTMVVEANSKVDVLFIVDDSASMAKHQFNLSRNIRSFVQEFEKNSLLDFHIGVTTVDDTQLKKEIDRRKSFDPQLANRKIAVNPLGKLIALKQLGTDSQANGPRYITKDTPDFVEVLERTLLVGAKPGPDQKNAEIIGPWFEELFPPVMAVLADSGMENQGFYRPEAFLAIVFITDANDSSKYEARDLFNYLMDLKGHDPNKVQAYAAIVPAKMPGCKQDDSRDPVKIEQFLDLFQNGSDRILNLCNATFGKKLAEFGRDIVEKVPAKIIVFPQVPERNSIKVYYASQLLEEGHDYDYSVGGPGVPHRIIISKDSRLKFEKDATFRVEYVRFRGENLANGRAKKI